MPAVIALQDINQFAHRGPFKPKRAAKINLPVLSCASEAVIFRRKIGWQLLLGKAKRIEVSLYDAQRQLFTIGYRMPDAESPGRLDSSYYDLLASEARLTSFIAIAKGDVPETHWFHLGRLVTRTGATVGVRCTLHDLRHTFATLALKEGVHPKIVSERLGHATVGITLDLYSHVTPAIAREAADTVGSLILGPRGQA